MTAPDQVSGWAERRGAMSCRAGLCVAVQSVAKQWTHRRDDALARSDIRALLLPCNAEPIHAARCLVLPRRVLCRLALHCNDNSDGRVVGPERDLGNSLRRCTAMRCEALPSFAMPCPVLPCAAWTRRKDGAPHGAISVHFLRYGDALYGAALRCNAKRSRAEYCFALQGVAGKTARTRQRYGGTCLRAQRAWYQTKRRDTGNGT